MIISDEGIILNTYSYSETSLIIKLYTKERGLISLIHKGAKKKKNKVHQALSLVSVSYYFKPDKDLHLVKEISLSQPFKTIYTNMYKASIALFLQELLFKSILEEQPNKSLFTFVRQFLIVIDDREFSANSHLWFAIELMKHLGVEPDNSTFIKGKVLNINEGIFKHPSQKDNACLSSEMSELFYVLSGTKFAALDEVKITNEQRRVLLQSIVDYYETQLELKKSINSHFVLKELLQ